ncbi:MAG TPA: acylphosphatase [Deltaproteobacteria bacterium]|nr:acylphosphatase [Deltaproteobacteria bacterium]
MNQRARIIVKGIVQGVYFRDSTRRKAVDLHVTGIVRNRPDGTVEIVCEGPEEAIKGLIEWCGHGPRGAFVEGLEITWGTCTAEFRDFRIVY